jgi:general secretion pathway protein L
MESLRVFWDWWRDQLLQFLPGHEERQRSRASDGLVLTDLAVPALGADPTARLIERRNGVDQPPSTVTLDPDGADGLRATAARWRLPIVLRLPGSLLLERDVSLPLAAERDLGRVLHHEMDRFTPFAAPEVLWTYALLHRDRAQSRLLARLSLVPRALAAPMLAILAEAGVTPAGLELATDSGAYRRIPMGERAERAERDDRLVRPALAGVLALAILATFSPFFWQSRAFSAVEARIAANAPAVAQVQHLRAAALSGASGAEVIAAERRRSGDPLEAIALLTDAIPDDTYLTGLTYDSGTVTIDGQSKSAAALIGPLTANPRLQDASFTAPVVRNALGMDSFSLRLKVAH